MSYILDALKKAESERKLGAIQNGNAPPAPSAPAHFPAPARRTWLPWLLALLMVGGAVAAMAWLQHRRPQPAPAQAAATPLPPALAPAPANIAAAPVLSSAGNAAPSASVPDIAPVPASRATKNPGEQEARPLKSAVSVQNAAAPALPATAAKVADAPPKAAPPKAAQPEEKPVSAVSTLQDLPENIQRELPAIVVNGYIYAKNPADRSVLIDKKLLHEGDQIGPDLMLEKMTPRGAILRYKGYRYQVAY